MPDQPKRTLRHCSQRMVPLLFRLAQSVKIQSIPGSLEVERLQVGLQVKDQPALICLEASNTSYGMLKDIC